MKLILIAVLMLAAGAVLAEPSGTDFTDESPYAGGIGDHYVIWQYKCGSGCAECALLYCDYDGVKVIHSKLFDVIKPKLALPKNYVHYEVSFVEWVSKGGEEVPVADKLVLKVFATDGEGTSYEWPVTYDLKHGTFTVGPRTVPKD